MRKSKNLKMFGWRHLFPAFVGAALILPACGQKKEEPPKVEIQLGENGLKVNANEAAKKQMKKDLDEAQKGVNQMFDQMEKSVDSANDK